MHIILTCDFAVTIDRTESFPLCFSLFISLSVSLCLSAHYRKIGVELRLRLKHMAAVCFRVCTLRHTFFVSFTNIL